MSISQSETLGEVDDEDHNDDNTFVSLVQTSLTAGVDDAVLNSLSEWSASYHSSGLSVV